MHEIKSTSSHTYHSESWHIDLFRISHTAFNSPFHFKLNALIYIPKMLSNWTFHGCPTVAMAIQVKMPKWFLSLYRKWSNCKMCVCVCSLFTTSIHYGFKSRTYTFFQFFVYTGSILTVRLQVLSPFIDG